MIVKNVGSADRIVRLVAGFLLIALPFLGLSDLFDNATYKYASIIVGLVLMGTAVLNFCPLYRIFGIRTCRI